MLHCSGHVGRLGYQALCTFIPFFLLRTLMQPLGTVLRRVMEAPGGLLPSAAGPQVLSLFVLRLVKVTACLPVASLACSGFLDLFLCLAVKKSELISSLGHSLPPRFYIDQGLAGMDMPKRSCMLPCLLWEPSSLHRASGDYSSVTVAWQG